MTMKCRMVLGDCLAALPDLTRRNVSLCFADLPYGATGYAWDTPLPAGTFLDHMLSVLGGRGPIIATGNEKFHLFLVNAWRRHFRYSLIWEKLAPSNFLQAHLRPMVSHEFIGIYGQTPTYNPQKTYGHPRVKKTRGPMHCAFHDSFVSERVGQRQDLDDSRHPRSILTFRRDKRTRRSPARPDRQSTHPSQKPVDLVRWLIRSYSKPGAHVVDPVSGSGTTAIAALAEGRDVTCIEKDPAWFDLSVQRLQACVRDASLAAAVEVVT